MVLDLQRGSIAILNTENLTTDKQVHRLVAPVRSRPVDQQLYGTAFFKGRIRLEQNTSAANVASFAAAELGNTPAKNDLIL